MKNRHLTVVAGLCALLALPSAAAAQDASELSLESLLDQQISSASKFAQRIADAPSAITVITAEDIRRMGAVHLPDVLRMVPGLNVRTKTSGTYAVNARAGVEPASPRMLVLLDGRVTSLELHSVTLWEVMIVSLDQVERIEVVRGPGSALYGANAYDGVINITTRRPTGGTDVTASAQVGEDGERRASAVYRQSLGAFRLDGFVQTAGTDVQGPGVPGPESTTLHRSVESTMGSLRLGWSNSSGVDLEVAAGIGETKSIHFFGWGGEMAYQPTDTRFVAAGYRHPTLLAGAELRARAAHTDRKVGGAASVRSEAEVTLDRAIGAHRLITGAVATRLHGDTSVALPGLEDQYLYGAYVQDVWTLSRAWELTAGVRWDHHPYAGGNLSPRTTLLFRPSQLHTIRFSAGRVFRNPTPLENHFFISVPMGPELNFVMSGSTELEPEAVESFELGYIGSPHPRVTVTADLFRNHHHENLTVGVTETITFPGNVVFPIRMQWMNVEGGNTKGGEASVVFAATDWMRLAGNYANVRARDVEGGPMPWVPEHAFNAEVGVRPVPALWLNATFHYAGASDYNALFGTVGEDAFQLPARSVVHLNADAALPRGLRASVFVQNVTGDSYRDVLGGELLGRRVVGRLSITF